MILGYFSGVGVRRTLHHGIELVGRQHIAGGRGRGRVVEMGGGRRRVVVVLGVVVVQVVVVVVVGRAEELWRNADGAGG